MDAAQQAISEWAESTFKHTEIGIAAHLLSEAAELYYSVNGTRAGAVDIVRMADRKQNSDAQIAEETADVTILAMTLAGYKGFSLAEEVSKKMGRNYKRAWGKPNELGFTEHLPEPGLPAPKE